MKSTLVALTILVAAQAADAQVMVGGGGYGGGGYYGGSGGYGVGWGSWSGYGGGYGTTGWGVGPWGWGRSSYGWGYGGWGWGGGSMIVAGDGYGLYYSGPVYGWGGGGSAVAPGVAAADPTPGWGPWGGYGGYSRRGGYWPPVSSTYSPPPPASTKKAPEEPLPTGAVDEGKRRFRMGDYRGALDTFRGGVVANGNDGVVEAHFALSLAVTGDLKNADKALRSALGHGFAGKIDVASMAKDDKERAKLALQLAKAPESSLSAAWALAGLGKPERLDALVAKDADAKKLR